MLKYSGSNPEDKDSNSLMTNIAKYVDYECIKQVIQPGVYGDVIKLFLDKILIFENNKLYLNGKVNFRCVDGYFIWPKEYPLHFLKTCDKYCAQIPVPLSDANVVDLNSWDLSSFEKLPTLTRYRDPHNLEPYFYYTDILVDSGNTSNVKEMDSTFFKLSNVENLDLSRWDLSNLTAMRNTFCHMTDLQNLRFKEQYLPFLKDTSYAFYNAGFEANIDLTPLRPKAVSNISHMFERSGFKKIDMSTWHFDENFDATKFMNNVFYLENFNGIALNPDGLSEDESRNVDWTRVCIDIIKQPEKYREFLVK